MSYENPKATTLKQLNSFWC